MGGSSPTSPHRTIGVALGPTTRSPFCARSRSAPGQRSSARAEAALRESEEKYRTLFSSIDEGFCVIEFLGGGDGRVADY
jgi:PAS domain-containing protein